MRAAHSPVSDTVILIDISEEDYSFCELESSWRSCLAGIQCPACGALRQFTRHGRYLKYFYSVRISILRVRCCRCRVTHALMPGFSLPGTSIGTEDAEAYLIDRASGLGRGSAGKGFLTLGTSTRYPKQLERMFATAISRGKAIFPEAAGERLSGMEWVTAVVGENRRPLWSLNRFSLAHRVNCLCFCRASVIGFSPHSARSRSSHNRGSPHRVITPGRL